MNIKVISHYVKEGRTKDGSPRGNKQKHNPIYISFLFNIPIFEPLSDVWIPKDNLDDTEPFIKYKFKYNVPFVMTGCRLSDGILRPPSMSGRYAGNWFPYIWFPYGLDNAMVSELYSLVRGVADEYGRLSEVLGRDECMAGWLTTDKAINNYKNLTLDLDKLVKREK